MSKFKECTTFSMHTGPDFDHWNLKSAYFFVYPLHFGNHFEVNKRFIVMIGYVRFRFWVEKSRKLRKKEWNQDQNDVFVSFIALRASLVS